MSGSLRILVVDDEENIRLTLSLCLGADGHQVTAEPRSGCAGRGFPGAFDLIFLDLRLGLENGLELVPDCGAESLDQDRGHCRVCVGGDRRRGDEAGRNRLFSQAVHSAQCGRRQARSLNGDGRKQVP